MEPSIKYVCREGGWWSKQKRTSIVLWGEGWEGVNYVGGGGEGQIFDLFKRTYFMEGPYATFNHKVN